MLFLLGNFGISILVVFSVFSCGWCVMPIFNCCSTILVSISVFSFFLCCFMSKEMQVFTLMTCLFSSLFFLSDSQVSLYVFFEAAIFPVVAMIIFFGNTFERFESSYFMIFFSAASSYPILVMLLSTSGMYTVLSMNSFLSPTWAIFFMVAFLVKLPLYTVHYWLPKAHVEAPTAGSMILAGVLLKLGGWGIIQMINFVVVGWGMLFWTVLMCLGAILSPAWAMTHSDCKGLVAFSSISHMNFSCVSIFLGASLSKTAGVLIFLTHDIISCMMFWIVGTIYHVSLSRQMLFFSSLSQLGVFCAAMSCFIMLSNFSFPPFLSFFHEFVFISICLSSNSGLSFVVFPYVILVSYFTLFLTMNLFIFKETLNHTFSAFDSILLGTSVLILMFFSLSRVLF